MKFQINSILDKIQPFIQLETYFFLWLALILCFIFYTIFLKEISLKRHLNLKTRFKSTTLVLILSTIFSGLHWIFFEKFDSSYIVRITHLSAIFSLFLGCIAVIKLAQIFVYLYLFLKNISQGIPRLIVNMFTVIFSLFIFSYIAAEVFSIHVTAMLATSAVFSLVLGLAMQDTLGNLFSGVAMQIGQPFKLGDWVEISHDSKKWTGQIQEITWRATFLSSFSDEWIMIPNKTIAQSEIIIFTNNSKTLRHSQLFRIKFEEDFKQVKNSILEAIKDIPEILLDPAPRVLLIDTSESYMNIKLFYSIPDFSMKYSVTDQVYTNVLAIFKIHKISLATNKLSIEKDDF